jgi:hypothetical protein
VLAVGVQLDAVVGIDVVPGRLEGGAQRGGDLIEGRLDLGVRHPEVGDLDVVEAQGQLPQGAVAAGTHGPEDVPHGLGRTLAGQLGGGEEIAEVAGCTAQVDRGQKRRHRRQNATPMSARAELSSITTALDELTSRLDAMLDSLGGVERDNLASDLVEVERALNAARRRLAKLADNAT